MFSLPLLIAEDIDAVDAALRDLRSGCDAQFALFLDGGGFVVTQQGEAAEMDVSTLGALAANSFAATQAIAGIIHEPSVTSLYQEGAENSLLLLTIGTYGFLAIVFPSAIGVGAVKFCAQRTVSQIGAQMAAAQKRAPSKVMDLAELNLADSTPLFQRRAV